MIDGHVWADGNDCNAKCSVIKALRGGSQHTIQGHLGQRDTLCQHSFKNFRIDFTQNFVTKLCFKEPVNPMKGERKLTYQIYIVESYAVESYKWKYQNWIYIVESYKNDINIVESYKSPTVWTDTHFTRQNMTTFNHLNIWSPAKGAKRGKWYLVYPQYYNWRRSTKAKNNLFYTSLGNSRHGKYWKE